MNKSEKISLRTICIISAVALCCLAVYAIDRDHEKYLLIFSALATLLTFALTLFVLHRSPNSTSGSQTELDAVNHSFAVATFKMDGTLINANAIFLSSLGLKIDKIKGRHHRMLISAERAADETYQRFWHDLKAGKTRSGKFRLIGKSERDVFFQGSYNPIIDDNGYPSKVMFCATDVSEHVLEKMELANQATKVQRNNIVSITTKI
jgi:PAS domain S-box-containing protein